MGQARRRKQQLGDLYGTPKGSNRELISYKGFDQPTLDQMALKRIKAAISAGQRVILMGTKAARPLAAAAGLTWLHERSDCLEPYSFAWDPEIAEAGGPLIPEYAHEGSLVIVGAGADEWLSAALPANATPS
jgi:hypothetical protein